MVGRRPPRRRTRRRWPGLVRRSALPVAGRRPPRTDRGLAAPSRRAPIRAAERPAGAVGRAAPGGRSDADRARAPSVSDLLEQPRLEVGRADSAWARHQSPDLAPADEAAPAELDALEPSGPGPSTDG